MWLVSHKQPLRPESTGAWGGFYTDHIPWHGDKTLTSVGRKQPQRIRDEAQDPSDSECDPPGADHGGDGAQHHQARPGPGDNIQVRNVN